MRELDHIKADFSGFIESVEVTAAGAPVVDGLDDAGASASGAAASPTRGQRSGSPGSGARAPTPTVRGSGGSAAGALSAADLELEGGTF